MFPAKNLSLKRFSGVHGHNRTTTGQHMHQLAIVTELRVDTDPFMLHNYAALAEKDLGADLLAHAGGGRSGQGGRRAAWRHQSAVPSQPGRATNALGANLSIETSSSIAKGTIQCLQFEILVMKDLLRSWPPARALMRPTSWLGIEQTAVMLLG
jgi:hypothetical protein